MNKYTINSELFSILYGEYVKNLIESSNNINESNYELRKLGHDIGIRIVDDLENSINYKKIKDFKSLVNEIGFIVLKSYFSIDSKIVKDLTIDDQIVLELNENILENFVIIPDKYNSLKYSNIIAGLLEGIMETFFHKVECTILKKNKNNLDFIYQIHIKYIEKIKKKLVDYDDD